MNIVSNEQLTNQLIRLKAQLIERSDKDELIQKKVWLSRKEWLDLFTNDADVMNNFMNHDDLVEIAMKRGFNDVCFSQFLKMIDCKITAKQIKALKSGGNVLLSLKDITGFINILLWKDQVLTGSGNDH